ncbi:chitin synthase-domain-containing protein [Dactylonectria estremocensis]|uniref:Chitin synthase n=1 Tax=Dactylonectria estremocensis TaxID=1079267 RepID=A0A9P9EQL8_9HYPO|nr:chitin synthase-domain-containing protein [Dactylonectria estremocensis]
MAYQEVNTIPELDSQWRDGYFDPRRYGVVTLNPDDVDLPQPPIRTHYNEETDQVIELEEPFRPNAVPDSIFGVAVPVPADFSSRATKHAEWFGEPNDERVNELSHLSYTALTTDPQGFGDGHHKLRPISYPKPRHTEILVGITVYSEQKHLLVRTLHSVCEGIRHLGARNMSKTWSKQAWKKVVICILVDGIQSVDPGVLDVLTSIGLYQDGLCRKTTPEGDAVTGHLFEYSSPLSLRQNSYTKRLEVDQLECPVQLMLLLKAQNSGKLNSYRWLYNAVGKQLNANVVVHLDVGTKLSTAGLYGLWKPFDLDPQLAAACGEITCSLDGNWWNLLNPIVAAQNFEYKVGFQLDRAFESATGFLSLLPGACSAYRYVGTSGKPLEDMLMGDPTWTEAHSRDPEALSPLNLNRHLADDRVICFQIITKKNTHWLLKYIRVKATTDIPMTTTDFINQRRRWLNGAFFSAIYVLKNFRAVAESDHTTLRKIVFCIPLLHSVLALILAWFSLAAFLLTTFTINSITGDPPDDAPTGGFPFGKATPIVNAVIQVVYMAMILFQFILALGSRPRNHRVAYVISFAIFGLVQVYLIMNLIYLVKRVADFKADDTGASNYAYIGEFYADIGQPTIIVAGFSVFGVYILSAILAFDPWHLFTCFAQFLFISSSYVNILNIYAFSNTHDVTWGKKGRAEDAETSIRRRGGPGMAMIERRFTFEDQDPAVRSTETQRDESAEARAREYRAALDRATAEEEPRSKDAHRPKVLATADALMEFRTIILASYVFSNFFVCLIVLNDSLKMLWWLGDSYWHKVWFFRIWLWANSISFLVRFAGALFYTADRLIRGY